MPKIPGPIIVLRFPEKKRDTENKTRPFCQLNHHHHPHLLLDQKCTESRGTILPLLGFLCRREISECHRHFAKVSSHFSSNSSISYKPSLVSPSSFTLPICSTTGTTIITMFMTPSFPILDQLSFQILSSRLYKN